MHYLLKALTFLTLTIATWRMLFLSPEIKSLLYEAIKIFSTFKTYLSLRNHTLKVKAKFDKYFYFELCALRVFINLLMDYFYLNIKQIDKLIFFEKYSLIAFCTIALLSNIPVKYQAMFYICSLVNKTIFYYERLNFGFVGFVDFGHFFLMYFYGCFKNRHLFWVRQAFSNGIFYFRKILKFYLLLVLMFFLVFLIRYSESEFLLLMKIDGLVISFILMFGYFFFKNDRYVYIWKSKHYYSHYEKKLKEKEKIKENKLVNEKKSLESEKIVENLQKKFK